MTTSKSSVSFLYIDSNTLSHTPNAKAFNVEFLTKNKKDAYLRSGQVLTKMMITIKMERIGSR